MVSCRVRPVDHIAWACEQVRVLHYARCSVSIRRSARETTSHPVLDLLRCQAVCAHLLTDCPFIARTASPDNGTARCPLPLPDTIPAQHLLLFQHRAKFDMQIVENVARLFQIGAAFKVQIARLGHFGEIIGDPLMLERCI